MGTRGAPVSRSSTLTFQPAENRLAEGVVHIPDSARLGLEIAPQEVTQHSVRRNETLPIALESETCTPVRARPPPRPSGLRPAGPLAVLLAPYIPQRTQRVCSSLAPFQRSWGPAAKC